MKCTKYYLLACVICFSSVFADDVIVDLPYGKIKGRVALTMTNATYYAFQKIPYAAPPVGELRFKPPVAPPKWDGILDATKLDVYCYQTSHNSDLETEDCLFVNVYTPQLPDDRKTPLPVMFYIYGGGFIGGNSLERSLGPEYLLDRGVIIVTINYRVGPFGFLSTQDSVIPGNNGLKDQHFAMKWTHDNIHLFGGDPDKIIIFGQSAGSASSTYQLLNPKNEGLFRGAICLSGSFLSPWAFQRRAREIAFRTAGYVDKSFLNKTNSEELLKFLQNLPAKEIDAASLKIKKEENIQTTQMNQGYFYAPVIEPESEHAVVTEKMYVSLKNGNIVKVPILIGVTSEERISLAGDMNGLRKRSESYDQNLDWIVPDDMGIENTEDRKAMGEHIRDIYIKNGTFASDLSTTVRYSSDNAFDRPVIKHAELQSKFTPVYFYQFSYHGKMGYNNIPELKGAERVQHSEELHYIWRYHNGKEDTSDLSKFPKEDVLTQRRMLEIWTNFAKYLNPTPFPSELLQNITWPTVSSDDFQYVDIRENLEIKNNPKGEMYTAWNAIYDSLDKDDFDTY